MQEKHQCGRHAAPLCALGYPHCTPAASPAPVLPVCVCVCVCVFVRVHVRDVYMCICEYVRACERVYERTCVCIYACACVWCMCK
jgi:hypothetical protein